MNPIASNNSSAAQGQVPPNTLAESVPVAARSLSETFPECSELLSRLKLLLTPTKNVMYGMRCVRQLRKKETRSQIDC